MDIGVGDFVEVYKNPDDNFPIGSVWLIEKAIQVLPPLSPPGCCDCGHDPNTLALTFKNDPGVPYGWGWCSCTFRPIYRPKAEILQGLLKPIREKEIA